MVSYILAVICSVLVLGADQLTKYLVAADFTLGETRDFLPGLIDFTYIHNRGGAWGMLYGHTYILLPVTVVIMALCVFLYIKYGKKSKLLFWAIALVLSGGIGNMIDRVFRGGNVVDFLHFVTALKRAAVKAMENRIETVCGEGENRRIDVFAAETADITRSRAAMLAEEGCIAVNGKKAQKNTRLKPGDRVEILVPEPVSYNAEPENIPLDIIYEDNDLLIVNKPKGMVVHPAAGNYGGTLVNALMYHCGDSLSGINGVMRPGIVHRIDKDTSGLLMVAKNDFAHNGLAAQIKDHSFTREYEAVVYGNIKDDAGTVDAPIGRHPVKRKQMAVVYQNSKPAVTQYSVVERLDGFTHLRLRLETGRTHQIRVHMAYIGHPVAGDEVYGPKKVITELHGQCLHAKKVGFVHPRTGEYMEFDSELPPYFIRFLQRCKQ